MKVIEEKNLVMSAEEGRCRAGIPQSPLRSGRVPRPPLSGIAMMGNENTTTNVQRRQTRFSGSPLREVSVQTVHAAIAANDRTAKKQPPLPSIIPYCPNEVGTEEDDTSSLKAIAVTSTKRADADYSENSESFVAAFPPAELVASGAEAEQSGVDFVDIELGLAGCKKDYQQEKYDSLIDIELNRAGSTKEGAGEWEKDHQVDDFVDIELGVSSPVL